MPVSPRCSTWSRRRPSGRWRRERHHLTRGAWVDHLPGWVRGSEAVLDVLLGIDWRAERRVMYDDEVDRPAAAALVRRRRAAAARRPHRGPRRGSRAHYAAELGEPFVTAGMCLYRDGRDSVAWHGDTKGRSAHTDTMVAIVSFGAPRPLLLRPRGGGTSIRFPLGHGDLVVMGGSCQRTWEHAVPKTARPVGPRVSVQFRPAGVA